MLPVPAADRPRFKDHMVIVDFLRRSFYAEKKRLLKIKKMEGKE
jgi:hypothetical protein